MLNHSRHKKPKGLLVCVVAAFIGLFAVLMYSKCDCDKPAKGTADPVPRPTRVAEQGSAAASSLSPARREFPELQVVEMEDFPELNGLLCRETQSPSFPKDFFYDSDRGGPVWDDFRVTMERERDYARKVYAIQSINRRPIRCGYQVTPLPAGGASSSDPIDEVVVTPPGIGKK